MAFIQGHIFRNARERERDRETEREREREKEREREHEVYDLPSCIKTGYAL